MRYDGVRFTVFNKSNSKGIVSNRFTCLCEDADKTLWIGTEGSSTQTESRARVIRKLIEYTEYIKAEYNPAFVLAEYYSYLRRDPDAGGYQFWLDVLNNRVPNNYRSMVCAFINSAEYQLRFSSIVIRTDKICGNLAP